MVLRAGWKLMKMSVVLRIGMNEQINKSTLKKFSVFALLFSCVLRSSLGIQHTPRFTSSIAEFHLLFTHGHIFDPRNAKSCSLAISSRISVEINGLMTFVSGFSCKVWGRKMTQ